MGHPYGIPPFERIRDEHELAFRPGIEQLRIEIAAIRDNPEPPTSRTPSRRCNSRDPR
jgi:hypothetical protein